MFSISSAERARVKFELKKRTCIFDSFIIPDNDNWVFELKKKKEQIDKMLKKIKLIK